MSAESTRRVLTAYSQELLSFGNYEAHLAEDVVVTVMGTDQEARGRAPARQMIDFMHRQAFETDVRIKSLICGDNQAMIEAEFIGTHRGEFAGVKASNRRVSVPYAVAYDLEADQIKAMRLYFPLDILLRQIGGSV